MGIKWGTILEVSTKSRNITLIESLLQQSAASISTGTGGPLRSRPLEKRTKGLLTIAFFRRIWLPLPKPVKNSSWPDPTGTSSLAPRHEDVVKSWNHIIRGGGRLIYMWLKPTLTGLLEATFPRSHVPQLIFIGRPTNFKFQSRRFNATCPGAIQTPSGSPDEP